MVTEVWQAGFHMRELDQRLGRDGDGGKVIHLRRKLLHKHGLDLHVLAPSWHDSKKSKVEILWQLLIS